MKRLNLLELLLLNAYWFGLSFKWNSLHVLILPAVLLNFAPETQKNTYLGLLTFAGLVVAMLLQPVSGAMSDRLGRRRPFILIGTLCDFIFLAVLGWAGGLLWLAVGYICLQFSSNIAHGPAQGLIPDAVPREQHGAASGIKNLMDMGGLVVSSLVVGRLLGPSAKHALLPMGYVAAVVAVATAITLLWGVKKPGRSQNPQPPPPSEKVSISTDSIRLAVQGLKSVQASFWWLICSRFIFLLGIYDIQVFSQYYIRDVFHVENPIKLTGDLLAAITLALIAFALAGGWLGDRLGHRRILYIASAISAVGCLLLVQARTPQALLLCGSVLGVGIGLFLTSNWALANNLAPPSQAGKYMGLTNLATAGAGAAGRLGGPLIDLLNNAQPGAYAGYTAMFVFGAVAVLLSALILKKVTTSRPVTSPHSAF